ncbi:MAG: ROK family protein [Propioniciclava sp.]
MPTESRGLNRSAVLSELLRRRPVSRRDIAAVTGISPATVTRTVEQLLAEGIVGEVRQEESEARGRRAVLLDVVADQRHVIGVDLGASNTRIIVADFIGQPLVARQRATAADLDARALAVWLAETIIGFAGPAWETTEVVGVGIPGAIRSSDGSITNAPNLPQVEDPSFVSNLQQLLGRNLLVDNDSNYALIGELRFGVARGTSTSAMLTIGAGLGVGMAVDGRIVRGHNGIIGEFGQLPVGPLGARLEHMVTGPGIMRHAADAGVKLSDPAELFDASNSSVAQVRRLFDQALLIVLTAVTVSCDPECIVLGGRVGTRVGADIERYRQGLLTTLNMTPTLAVSELGDLSGAAGAVAVSLQHSYRTLGAGEPGISELPAASPLNAAQLQTVLTDKPDDAA